jgi:geranylgeranylglycerol-phosphate geranylgeranyltransferase
MRSASALFTLIRWENALLSAAGVLVGAWWVRGSVTATNTLITALAAIALTAVANAENDYRDRELDRAAHPSRPLPSGRLRPRDARAVVIASAAIAVVCSAMVSVTMAIVTCGIIALMLAYSRWLKARGLIGNVTVAVLASLPFAYGAWSAGQVMDALPLVGVAIPLHLAREIAKDLEDAGADAATRRTLPVIHGPDAARVTIVGTLVVFVAMLVPLVAERPALGVFVLPALALALAAAQRAWRGRHGSPSLFKAAMACAMVSLVLSYWRR